jgi:hypothetical protein
LASFDVIKLDVKNSYNASKGSVWHDFSVLWPHSSGPHESMDIVACIDGFEHKTPLVLEVVAFLYLPVPEQELNQALARTIRLKRQG